MLGLLVLNEAEERKELKKRVKEEGSILILPNQ